MFGRIYYGKNNKATCRSFVIPPTFSSRAALLTWLSVLFLFISFWIWIDAASFDVVLLLYFYSLFFSIFCIFFYLGLPWASWGFDLHLPLNTLEEKDGYLNFNSSSTNDGSPKYTPEHQEKGTYENLQFGSAWATRGNFLTNSINNSEGHEIKPNRLNLKHRQEFTQPVCISKQN